MPGDLIVVDECQRLFRPVPFGRKVPGFIAKLETHGHYGVDFLLITQHPQLLHSNVRNLIGRHQHVRRIRGGHSAIIYEWDHCTHPDKTKSAEVSYWRYDKKAFALYKSAEAHTKPVVGKPLALYGIAAMITVLVGLTLYMNSKRHHVQAEAAAASSPVAPAVASAVQASKPTAAVILAMAAAHPAPPGPDELPPLPDHVAGCFVVNIHRKDMSTAQIADFVALSFKKHKSLDKVCTVMKKSKPWVSKHLAVTRPDFGAIARQMLTRGECEDLEVLGVISQLEKLEAFEAIDELRANPPISRAKARQALKLVKAKPEEAQEPASEENEIGEPGLATGGTTAGRIRHAIDKVKDEIEVDRANGNATWIGGIHRHALNRMAMILRNLEPEVADALDELIVTCAE